MATSFTVTATATKILYGPSEWAVGRWLVSIQKNSGAGTFTVKPQKRLRVEGSGATNLAAPDFADCWYMNALTNSEIAAGTTQTATYLFDIDSSGCDTQLVFTLSGANSIAVTAVPLLG